MGKRFTKNRIILRFTLSFILHQIFLFTAISIPPIFYINVLNESQNPVILNATAWIVIIVYVLYCIFYGYYIARPMYDILTKIKKLSSGEYDLPTNQSKFPFPSTKLFREVYLNIKALSNTLQENEKKRKEFFKLRQEWASGVTHDLKTPLSYISGYTDMLLSEEHSWNLEERREFLYLIKVKSLHMEDLINDLGIAFRMDQSVGIEFERQKIELGELIRRAVAEVANMPSEKDNVFVIVGGESPTFIEGDPKLLQRAFSNLLINAVVHNPSKTKIEIKINKSDHVKIQIKDDGQGIDTYSVEHLFDRYYRGTSTDGFTGGTGLGMAIVKQIVTAHHGEVKVESNLREGTCITIKLPMQII